MNNQKLEVVKGEYLLINSFFIFSLSTLFYMFWCFGGPSFFILFFHFFLMFFALFFSHITDAFLFWLLYHTFFLLSIFILIFWISIFFIWVCLTIWTLFFFLRFLNDFIFIDSWVLLLLIFLGLLTRILLKLWNRIKSRLKGCHFCDFLEILLVTLFLHSINIFYRKLLNIARNIHLSENIIFNFSIFVLFLISTIYNCLKNLLQVGFLILNTEVSDKFVCFLSC